ncbi:MAG: hypothetical protein HY710_09625 [Candidatus Latescibacteria bacterium]|nr:hypothetical protein [Candidatus Latescibacterota bacterium]
MIKLPKVTDWDTPDWGIRVTPRDGRGIDLRDMTAGRAGVIPDDVPVDLGFAPRGAVIDPANPMFEFSIRRKEVVWAETIAELVEQANAEGWNATTDVEWATLRPLPEAVERAVCQCCTCLIENATLALYLVSKFLPRIDPRFTEVVLFLTAQMHDEAREVEVFTKRALANGGGLQYVSAATEWSLRVLLSQDDYSEASFMLHLLGAGTWLDLLRFLEEVAPDPATAHIYRRVRQDEARHVAYGISHFAYHLQHDATVVPKLVRAAQDRVPFLRQAAGAVPFMQHAMAVLAGGGSAPDQVERGLQRVGDLYRQMQTNLLDRLRQAGFDQGSADYIAGLYQGAVKVLC